MFVVDRRYGSELVRNFEKGNVGIIGRCVCMVTAGRIMVVLGEFQRLMFRAASRPGRKGAAFALLRDRGRFLYVSRFRYN